MLLGTGAANAVEQRLVAEVDLLTEIAQMEVRADAFVFHVEPQSIKVTGLNSEVAGISQHSRVGTGFEHAPIQALRDRAMSVVARSLHLDAL